MIQHNTKQNLHIIDNYPTEIHNDGTGPCWSMWTRHYHDLMLNLRHVTGLAVWCRSGSCRSMWLSRPASGRAGPRWSHGVGDTIWRVGQVHMWKIRLLVLLKQVVFQSHWTKL